MSEINQINNLIPDHYKDRAFLKGEKRKNYRSKNNFPEDHILGTITIHEQKSKVTLDYQSAKDGFNKLIKSKFASQNKTCIFSDDQKQVLENLVKWLVIGQTKFDIRKGIWLWGDHGTGKTTIMRLFASLIINARNTFDDIPKITTHSYDHIFDDCRDQKNLKALSQIKGNLYVDDILYMERNELKIFGETERMTDLIINRMYNSFESGNRVLLTTSNYNPDNVLEAGMIHKGNHSRIKEMFNIIYWNGENHRK